MLMGMMMVDVKDVGAARLLLLFSRFVTFDGGTDVEAL